MYQLFIKLTEQLNSSVFILLVLLACALWAMYKMGKWNEKFKHHGDKINNVEKMHELVIELKTKVNLIYQNTNPRSPVASSSPIGLTDSGIEISENIQANKILQKYIGELINQVELEKPINAYDIQMSSMNVAKEKMITFLTEEELNTVKKEAYNRGLLLDDIMSVFGVLLRNHILSQKGIPISDVDAHAPSENA